MRALLNVIEWIEAVRTVPQQVALVLAVFGASMLVLGLRYWRLYLALAVAVLGFVFGSSLAALMGVSRWYVSPAAALLAGGLGYASAPFVMPVLVGGLFGAAAATAVGPGLDATTAWLVAGGGLVTGTALAVLFRRFAIALLFGALGSVALVGAAKPALGAPGGALGAALDNQLTWAIGATVLLVFAMIAQPAIEPETED